MNRLINICVVSIFVLAMSAAIAEAQPRQITKEEYDRAFEKAEQATTYPYRETIKHKSYTYYDSPEAEGEEILSQLTVTEYSGPDRLRTTVTTETEKGKKVVQMMQLGSTCYTLAGTRWKKSESCSPSEFTIAMRPAKEEYSAENQKLGGADVRIYRHIEINGDGRSETSFMVDAKWRMLRREGSNKVSAYEYDIKITPVALPRRSSLPRTIKRPASR